MILNDIASDIQNLLGLKYKIYPNTNANEFFDINSNTTIEFQEAFSEDWYTGIIRKTSGTMVPLRELFTTSFGYVIDFYVPVKSPVLEDIERLTKEVNGALKNNGSYKYVMTINEPTPVGPARSDNGIPFQVYSVTGDIALSDKSLFGNDFKLTINTYEIKGVIDATPVLQPKYEGDQQKANSISPSLFPDYYTSTISLILHGRNDDPFIMQLIDFVFDPNLLLNNEEFEIKFDYFGKTKTWETAYLTGISFNLSIGGYVIVSCGFVRSEAI